MTCRSKHATIACLVRKLVLNWTFGLTLFSLSALGSAETIVSDGLGRNFTVTFSADGRLPDIDAKLGTSENPVVVRLSFSFVRAVSLQEVHVEHDATDITQACKVFARSPDSQSLACDTEIPLVPGGHEIRVKVLSAETRWRYLVLATPKVTMTPTDDAVFLKGDEPVIEVQFQDRQFDIAVDDISLVLDGQEVSGFELQMANSRQGVLQYTIPRALSPGQHVVTAVVPNSESVATQRSAAFVIRDPTLNIAEWIAPIDHEIVQSAIVDLVVYAITDVPNELAPSVWVNDEQVLSAKVKGEFRKTIHLVPGANSVRVRIQFEDGEIRTFDRTVIYKVPRPG